MTISSQNLRFIGQVRHVFSFKLSAVRSEVSSAHIIECIWVDCLIDFGRHVNNVRCESGDRESIFRGKGIHNIKMQSGDCKAQGRCLNYCLD